MSVTNKGIDWELRHSLWVIWGFFALAWVAFLIIGNAAKKKLWTYFGLGYAVLFVLWMAMTETKDGSSTQDIGTTIGAFVLFGGLTHCFLVRKEYLRRRAVIEDESESFQKVEMEDTRRRMREEQVISPAEDIVGKAQEKLRRHIEERQQPTVAEPAPRPKSQTPRAARPAARKPAPVKPLDINSCTEEKLAELPGISLVMAKKAIDYRSEHGGFQSADEFFEVIQLKPHFVVQVQEMIMCEPEADEQRPTGIDDAPTGRKLDL